MILLLLMKCITTIVAFFLLFMSLLPCGDTLECNYKAMAQVSTADGHKQHAHSSEICSPFCICSCCAVSTYFAPAQKLQVSKIIIPTQKFPLYNVVFNTEAHYTIWQPPQLS